MSEAMDTFEVDLGNRLRQYVAAADVGRDAATVVQGVTSQGRRTGLGWIPLTAAAVLAVVAIGSFAILGPIINQSGSRPSQAIVAGVPYGVAVARSLQVETSDLTRHGEVQQSDFSYAFAEQVAYALRGVDPLAALVVPAKPGLGDEAGPWGDFIMLWGPGEAFPAICQYFEAGAPATPLECQAGQ